jgi:serine/threonine-protein kinase
MGGSGDVVSQPSDYGVLAGYRLHAEPRVDPCGWLGSLCATAPAIREADGIPATAHVVLGVTDRPTRRRLLAEVTALKTWTARRQCPQLAEILDHAVDADGHPVLFTVPFGLTLAGELVERGPLPLAEVMAAAEVAAAGLAALHEAGRLHHVISPRALLRLPHNGVQLSSPAVPALAEQMALDRDGTGHEPPEVLTSGEWTPAGDVYALGSTLWTLLAGVPPTSGSQEERLARIYAAKPPAMSRQDVPAAVLSALTAAVATDPADRPAGAHELLAMLAGHTAARSMPAAGQDTLPPNRPTPVAGRPLGKNYWLDERIDEGSTGAVYRARRLSDDALLAAKLLRRELADDQTVRTRFLAEGATLLRVDHPNLVRMHDMIADGHDLAIVMDFADGATLRKLIRDPRLGRTERLRLLGQVADALSAVHREGIVHRDVKPENVLVTGTGVELTAMLTDFGIAKALGQPTITHHSQLLGTMAYVAPELVAGRAVTTACDVYSLGVTAYELLAMRRPFEADNAAALMHAHMAEALHRPPELTDEEWGLLSACLEKEPTARPRADEVAARLAWLAGQPRGSLPAAGPSSGSTGSTATEPTEPLATDAVSAPWISSPPLPLRPVDQVVDELQPTAGATRPVPSAPAEPAPPRRRRWPLLTAVLATASVGAAIGVWLATPASPTSTEEKGEPTGPPLYPVAINTHETAEGHVLLKWESEVEKLPGFQSYSVFRDGTPFAELNGGTAHYLDPEPGTRPCYRVFALGVTKPPPDPPPPVHCVDR